MQLTIFLSLIGACLTQIIVAESISDYFLPKALIDFHYEEKFQNIADKTNQTTGIMVVAFNRPHYFRQVIESLEMNPESQTLPFYFFLEGGKGATQQENLEIINSSNIKHNRLYPKLLLFQADYRLTFIIRL